MLISLKGKVNEYILETESGKDEISTEGELFHVYRGKIKHNEELVIIKKIIDNSLILNKEHLILVNEIYSGINQIDSGIAKTLDIIECNGSYYIIREYIKGINLHTLSFDPDYPQLRHPVFLIQIACKICDILTKLHTNGIIHRNIKPSNIIISSNEYGQIDMYNFDVYIVDFERAQIVGRNIFQFKRIPFSLVYSPPELVLKHYDIINESIDLFGLGLSLFESFARVPVYETDNRDLILNLQISYPVKKKPNVPFALFQIIQKATCKHIFKIPPARLSDVIVKNNLQIAIQKRFTSAYEMKQELELFLQKKTKKPVHNHFLDTILKGFTRK